MSADFDFIPVNAGQKYFISYRTEDEELNSLKRESKEDSWLQAQIAINEMFVRYAQTFTESMALDLS